MTDEFAEFNKAVRRMGWECIRVLRIDRLAAWLSARLNR